ncbi:hypothetical protein KBI23_04590 [bacterium]|nr:hypothetical protein [bacterium]MBP9807383.1 hypothetical protein [bacterium]
MASKEVAFNVELFPLTALNLNISTLSQSWLDCEQSNSENVRDISAQTLDQ